MTVDDATAVLMEWNELLRAIAAVELSCDLSPEQITERLALRQQSIDRIQQLDGALTEVRRLRAVEWIDNDLTTINKLIADSLEISDIIERCDLELVDIASKNRLRILENLRRTTLAKGYFNANSSPKLRPPVIVDDRA